MNDLLVWNPSHPTTWYFVPNMYHDIALCSISTLYLVRKLRDYYVITKENFHLFPTINRIRGVFELDVKKFIQLPLFCPKMQCIV